MRSMGRRAKIGCQSLEGGGEGTTSPTVERRIT